MNKQEAINQVKLLKARETFMSETIWVKQDDAIDIISQIHEPQKPVVPKFVAEWLKENLLIFLTSDKILDTHVGSASSLIAFEEAGLEYVACEKDKEIYQSAMARLEEYKSQIKLF